MFTATVTIAMRFTVTVSNLFYSIQSYHDLNCNVYSHHNYYSTVKFTAVMDITFVYSYPD